MSLTYTTYTNQLANMMAVSPADSSFQIFLPGCIDDAEDRLYRELDLLNTVQTDTGLFSSNNRNFTLPTTVGTFLVVNQINVVTPSSTTNPNLGTRNPLTPVSKDYLDLMWPSITGATLPTYYAMVTQGTIVVGPWPDAAYTVEVVGTQKPLPLTSSNTTTILTTYFPDLFIAASMIFASAFQKNFSAMGDDPKMSVGWKQHYDDLMRSAQTEETRKKYSTGTWAAAPPTPLAEPPGR